jgi:hypothetical protein
MRLPIRPTALLLSALLALPLAAQAQSRADLVRRIAEAQGLPALFEQQAEQQREGLRAAGTQLFDDAMARTATTPGPMARQALDRFKQRAGTAFTAAELTAAWARAYGESSLTDEELKAILAWYASPVGKKDGAAAQSAMKAFGAAIAEQQQQRGQDALDKLAADLREILP